MGMRWTRVLAWVAVAVSAVPAWGGGPGDLFTVDGRVVRRGVVTAGDTFDEGMVTGSPMLDRLAGVEAELDPREIAKLRQACEAEGEGGVPDGLRRIGVVHLIGAVGTRRVEVSYDPAGELHARDLDDESAEPVHLDPRLMGELMMGWLAPVPTGGKEREVAKWPGRVVLTDAVVTQRYTGRGLSRASAGLAPMGRVLSDDRFVIKLPAGHDGSSPAGVLVWISPVEEPWMPKELEAAANELGLITVGALNNGNKRDIIDRLQVTFDSLETVRRNHFVDDDRVYLTGVSGGARCSSILVAVFPEVFCGAVPIVGLNSWHKVPLEENKYIPKQFARPRAEVERVLRTRRVRGITGSEDFNGQEMRLRTKMCVEDGLNYVLDDYEGMKHEMATAERFATALRWVDEPRREALAAGAKAAEEQLRAHVERFGEGPAADEEARASLVEVTKTGPWSEAAWRAAAWLGYERPDGE